MSDHQLPIRYSPFHSFIEQQVLFLVKCFLIQPDIGNGHFIKIVVTDDILLGILDDFPGLRIVDMGDRIDERRGTVAQIAVFTIVNDITAADYVVDDAQFLQIHCFQQ